MTILRSHNVRSLLAKLALTAASVALVAATASAQGHQNHPTPPPIAKAVPLKGTIKIDGKPDEVAWQAAPAIDQFTQFNPDEGKPATQRTEVRFLYDNDALYVGAWLFDTEGRAGITGRLVRRDQAGDGEDLFQVIFDTFHDHQGRTRFEMNPAGVRNDATGSGTQNPDQSWDPIYEAASSIDDKGWYVEMRIPLSQLRYPRNPEQTWGIQVRRFRAKNAEEDDFAFWHKTDFGGPPSFGHLEGLVINAVPERAEILPYVVSRASYIKPASKTDPFNPGHKFDQRIGADVKYSLTSNITLDATINPDFGQVEVDPASVNLSAFETFFDEKRPFFVANSGFFNFGGFSCFFCSNTSSLPSFYTRRIGRAPQISASGGTYVDQPENSTILGAAKITGRTAGGTSIGILNALTRKELATVIDTNGVDRKYNVEVEPLTNYFVGRVKRDYQGGNTTFGLIGTSVLRRTSDSTIKARLSSHAETFGADFRKGFRNHRYNFLAALEESHVSGSPLAINRFQRSSARYFQRPDRGGGSNNFLSSDLYDPNATSLSGFGGYSRFSKDAGDWLGEIATNFRSPGFEVNDISFITRSDFIMNNANIAHQWTKPTKTYRDRFMILGAQEQTNFDGDRTDGQVHFYVNQNFLNYWFANFFYIWHPVAFDDRATRGGPVVKRTGYHYFSTFFATDNRKPVLFQTSADYGTGIGDKTNSYDIFETVVLKPKSNVKLSFGPGFSYGTNSRQFVRSVADPTAANFYGTRYVFANLKQNTLSMNTRADVTFTPALTLQLFAQPFISAGAYTRFKEYVKPRTLATQTYGKEVGTITSSGSGGSKVYTIDPDGTGPASSFTVNNPDFNFRSLRGTAVLRWEYRPGSTMFLVWNQVRSDQVPFGDFDFTRDRQALFRAHPDNVFLVKFNYFFGL